MKSLKTESSKVHLTSKRFLAKRNPLVIRSNWARKSVNWVESSIFYPFSTSLVELLRVRGQASTQEPNTIALQSAVCICSRKWKTKLILLNIEKTSLRTSCLYITNGKLDMEVRLKNCFSCIKSVVISSPKTQSAHACLYSPFTFVLRENVFRQGMVVLPNPICVLPSGMLLVFKSDVSKFSRLADLRTQVL